MIQPVIQSAVRDGVTITLKGQGNIKVKGEADLVKKWLPAISEYKQAIIAYLEEQWVNRYCDKRTFDLYGNQMAGEQGLGRVYEVREKALKIGIHDEQAWDFAEAMAVSEFSGDNRRACLECSRYRHEQGSNHGVCTAAGAPPLEHMTRGASVNWYWLNRCQKHLAINPVTKGIKST